MKKYIVFALIAASVVGNGIQAAAVGAGIGTAQLDPTGATTNSKKITINEKPHPVNLPPEWKKDRGYQASPINIFVFLQEKRLIPGNIEAKNATVDIIPGAKLRATSLTKFDITQSRIVVTYDIPVHSRKYTGRKNVVQKHPQAAVAGGLTLAALTAAALGAAGMKIRNYQNNKKRLVKKYEIGNLTPLQDKTWLATLLARYGFTGRLHALVRNNPDASLTDFAGSDPRALAELYYGKTPTGTQFNRFIKRFFKGR